MNSISIIFVLIILLILYSSVTYRRIASDAETTTFVFILGQIIINKQ